LPRLIGAILTSFAPPGATHTEIDPARAGLVRGRDSGTGRPGTSRPAQINWHRPMPGGGPPKNEAQTEAGFAPLFESHQKADPKKAGGARFTQSRGVGADRGYHLGGDEVAGPVG
jgi:hypothetical protein